MERATEADIRRAPSAATTWRKKNGYPTGIKSLAGRRSRADVRDRPRNSNRSITEPRCDFDNPVACFSRHENERGREDVSGMLKLERCNLSGDRSLFVLGHQVPPTRFSLIAIVFISLFLSSPLPLFEVSISAFDGSCCGEYWLMSRIFFWGDNKYNVYFVINLLYR